jgi:tetratricopeptide (TPR) repeat protein
MDQPEPSPVEVRNTVSDTPPATPTNNKDTDATVPVNTPVKTYYPVESGKKLSSSLLWDLQRQFYEEQNVNAWSQSLVPHFVSSNAYLANCYARLIIAYATDVYKNDPSFNYNHPPENTLKYFNIVEIGAGHGKFGYLVLQKLLKLQDFWPRENCFRYILTDFVQETVDFWAQNEPFDPFFRAGMCDYAKFDAEKDTQIFLQRAHQTLDLKNAPNSIFISNYVFDTLKQDAFRIQNGKLEEVLCSIFSEKENDSIEVEGLMDRLKIKWGSRVCDTEYYGDENEEFNSILEYYLRKHLQANFLVPTGGLNLIQNVKKMTNNRFMWLLGDKAYTQECEFGGLNDPHIAFHGSFSFMANFHAIKLYVDEVCKKGFSYVTDKLEGFKCAALVVGTTEDIHRRLEFQWYDTMSDYNPEDFSNLQRSIKQENSNPSLKTALCTTRLAHWDPDVFLKFKRVLIDKTPYASEKEQVDIYRDAQEVWSCYYPLQKEKDVAFEIGRLMMGLRRYDEGIKFFVNSNKYCGEHHVTWYNIGICRSYVGEYDASLIAFDKSLEMKPDYQDAIRWRARVVETAGKKLREGEGDDDSIANGGVNVDDVNVQEFVGDLEREANIVTATINTNNAVNDDDVSQLPSSLQRIHVDNNNNNSSSNIMRV